MKVNIVASEMYLEVARAFTSAQIGIGKNSKGITNPNQLPLVIRMNMQFALNAIAITYSIAFLESYINTWLHGILFGDITEALSKVNWPDNEQKTVSLGLIDEFREEYKDEDSHNLLFRRTKLTKKIKLLHKILVAEMPYESEHQSVRLLWEDLIKLEGLRNKLIHFTPDSFTSAELNEFVAMTPVERKKLVAVPAQMIDLMTYRLPVALINSQENVLIGDVLLKYRDHPFLEQFMFGLNSEDDEVS